MADQLHPLAWMAWTWQTAAFFAFIGLVIALMGLWEWRRPGGAPRRGVLRIHTTRGDRLFISLLGSAFLHLAWIAAVGHHLGVASALSAVYAVAVFRWV